MTIENFQNLYRISNADISDEDKATLYVQEMTGKSEAQVDAMPLSKFNSLCADIEKAFKLKESKLLSGSPKQYIRVNGNLYYLNYEVKKPAFTAGRFVEIATFGNDIIGNLHKIMASMASPMKWSMRKSKWLPVKVDGWMHEQIAMDFLQADFKVAYHAAVFFYAVFTNSIKVLQPYFLSEMSTKMSPEQAEATLSVLQKTLDGFTMPRWYRNLKLSL